MLYNADNLKPGMVAVVGLPFDANSSFMQGAALAPARIRQIWSAGACNLCSESGIDLEAHADFKEVASRMLERPIALT